MTEEPCDQEPTEAPEAGDQPAEGMTSRQVKEAGGHPQAEGDPDVD
jgi:hypothetical protein